MKKVIITVMTCLMLVVLLASTHRNQEGIIIDQGFISTKTGVPVGNLGDTSYVRISGDASTGGNCRMTSTVYGGSVESKDYYLTIEQAPDGYIYIKCGKNGLYLGIDKSDVALDKQPGEANRFIIRKKSDNLFTVESAQYPGLFLNTTESSQISYNAPKRAEEVHFLEKEQEWFFLKPF